MISAKSSQKRHIPIRTCVICGTKTPKRELIRVVFSPDVGVEIDTTGKKPGRGAYICKSKGCWEQALKRKRIEYALKAKVAEDGWSGLKKFADSIIRLS